MKASTSEGSPSWDGAKSRSTEIEEEPLWDGQAKSSRYQDFSRSGFVTPPEFDAADAAAYRAAGIT